VKIFVVVLVLLVVALYLLPTIVGVVRRHHNLGSIVIVNVFLGWTFLGWVVALALSMSATVGTAPNLADAPPPLPLDSGRS
jgi:hypothetical protein